jgi:LPXTG-motif cell wall-anchored protein
MMEVSDTSPEPSFMILSGLGFAGLASVAYRRRRRVLPLTGITP